MTLAAPGTASRADRWLAADRAAAWERAEVVAVERGPCGTTLALRLAEVPRILPGQYYLVRLAIDTPPGVVEQAYSVCSSPYPLAPEIEIAVRPVDGGRASPLLAHRAEVGDTLAIRGPFGFLTWTERDGGPVGLVGAGSGVAPLVSIVRYAAARGTGVPMTMLCSARDGRSSLLDAPLHGLATEEAWLRVCWTFTQDATDRTSRYHRRVDVPMLAEVFEQSPPARRPRIYYVAGPGAMVVTIRAMLGSLGVADDCIYSEDHA